MLQSLDTLIAFVVIMTIVSLFVTVVVQMISASLSLRGKNLANALALTFQTIVPSLNEQAHNLAAKILSDPLLSDSTITARDRSHSTSTDRDKAWGWWSFIGNPVKLASAIRPEEVYDALKKTAALTPPTIAANTEPTAEQANTIALIAAATKVTAGLGVSAKQASLVAQDVAAISDLISFVSPELKAQFNQAIATTSANLVKHIDQDREQLEHWFGSAQDRAQQWFRFHTGAFTLIVSIVLTFLWQLDAVEIYHYYGSNPDARNAVIAHASKIDKDLAAITTSHNDLLERINTAWVSPHKNLTPEQLEKVTNTDELEKQLTIAAGGAEQFKKDEYHKTFDSAFEAYKKEQGDKLDSLKKVTAGTGFDLAPAGGWRWPNELPAAPLSAGWWDYVCVFWKHLPGLVLFAALLSLGAPYWYNLLKTLSSLKPALAQIIGTEDTVKEEKKK